MTFNKLYTDFSIQVASVNGSGSQSSNQILVRALFRSGTPVGGKNLFPSNIQGLATWFTIRVNAAGWVGRKEKCDILVCLNAATLDADIADLENKGLLIAPQDILNESKLAEIKDKRPDLSLHAVPFKELVAPLSESVKVKKLLINMVYVGVLAEILKIDESILQEAIVDQFVGKENLLEPNQAAVKAGRNYAKDHINVSSSFALEKSNLNQSQQILIDGNSAAAMGAIFGGCSFVSWYPITPSSSLVESFIELAKKWRIDSSGKNTFAVIQAEDELAAIAMVVGAGWAGARAMTATSGPGLSLMAEAAGLSYYAEVPAVIWDVQRAGPSTGLPTRTQQGDVLKAYHLSHGDTKHICLLPSDPKECFELAQTAFDLAERLQTLVIVLSDLDLGMNLHSVPEFKAPSGPLDRGKIFSAEQLDKQTEFFRYRDTDGDGIAARTLPGTKHSKAAYFTRGTGHDEKAHYSESPEVYRKNLERLERKWQTAKRWLPTCEFWTQDNLQRTPSKDSGFEQIAAAKIGWIGYGSSHLPILEARSLLGANAPSYLKLKALPLTKEVEHFLSLHGEVFVIEQNRDQQLRQILAAEFPQWAHKLRAITQYDGMPLTAEYVVREFKRMQGDL